jgi:hypothetical protein
MNDELLAAVEGQDREFEESAAPVEAQDELFGGHVIIWIAGVDPVLGRTQDVALTDPVLERREVDLHAT